MTEWTTASPTAGVSVAQPARGFRYTSDAMWLAGFALDVAPGARSALDLGTGSGVVALLLAARGVPTRGIDSAAAWRDGWARTLALSRVAAPVELVHGDVLDGVGGPYELVVSNPPFFAPGTGPTSPDAWKRAARTESSATLADFLRIGCGALTAEGRMCLVVPREREREVLAAPLPVARWVQVGRRRSLFALGRGEAASAPEVVDEDAAERWVARATRGAA